MGADLAFDVVGVPGLEPGTSSLSGLLRELAHMRQARSRWLLRCPGLTVTTLGRPPDRARGGHDLLIRRNLNLKAYRPPATVPLSCRNDCR